MLDAIKAAKNKQDLKEIYNKHLGKFDRDETLAFARKGFALNPKQFALQNFQHHMLDKKTGDFVPFCKFHEQLFVDIENMFFDRVLEKKLINVVARDHAKSTLGALIVPIWAGLHGYSSNIVVVSDTNDQAILFTDSIQKELETNQNLIGLYGNVKGRRWGRGDFELANGASFWARGAGQRIRGVKKGQYRIDLLILDDLENNENVATELQRQKLEDWLNTEVLPSVEDSGIVIYNGTIIHRQALLAKVYGLEVEGHKQEYEYTGWLKRFYPAHGIEYDPAGVDEFAPLWPQRKSREHWIALKEDYARRGKLHLYYREFLNKPISSRDQKFKTEYFRYFETEKIVKKQTNTFFMIDSAPSGDANNRADFNVVLVIKWDAAGNGYVVDYFKKRCGPKELIDKLFDFYAQYRPRAVGIQSVAFEQTLKHWIKSEMKARGIAFKIVGIKTNKVKNVVDAECLEPFFKMGFIHHMEWMRDLEEQLLTYPQCEYDDLLDCLVMSLELRQLPARNENGVEKKVPNNHTGY